MFTESNTAEQMILDAAMKLGSGSRSDRRTYVPAEEVSLQPDDVMVEPWLREVLYRLNPETAADPDRANEVIYKSRAVHHSVNANRSQDARQTCS